MTTTTYPTIPLRRPLAKRQPEAKPGLPIGMWIMLAFFVVCAAFSPDRDIGLPGVLVLWFCAKLLWRPGQPQTLFFIIMFQWLQAFGPVLQSLIEGVPYADMMGVPEFEQAIWLSLASVAVLALGTWLISRKSDARNLTEMARGLIHLNGNRLLVAWFVCTLATAVVLIGGRMYAPITQAFSAVEMMKWAVVLLIFYRWTATGKGMAMALGLLVLESLIGLTGFFSTFKTVFFALIIAGTGTVRLTPLRVFVLILMGIIMLLFFGFWQVVKGYYRNYMSDGERAQIITVSLSDRVKWMGEAVRLVSMEHLEQGWQEGLKRMSYVDYFGYAIKNVPAVVPFTGGQLWGEAVQHTLMPRIFFPNKAALDDSARTNAYCGISVTGADEGTSIGIGFVGESYIDFGPWGMFLPILSWGAFVGLCYHWLRKHAPRALLGMAMGTALVLQNAMLIETSNIKMFGGMIVGFLGLAIAAKFFGRGLWAWLIKAETRSGNCLRGADAPAAKHI